MPAADGVSSSASAMPRRPGADLAPVAQVGVLGRRVADHRALHEPGGLERQPPAEDDVVAHAELLRPARRHAAAPTSRSGSSPNGPDEKIQNGRFASSSACLRRSLRASALPALHVDGAAEDDGVVALERSPHRRGGSRRRALPRWLSRDRLGDLRGRSVLAGVATRTRVMAHSPLEMASRTSSREARRAGTTAPMPTTTARTAGRSADRRAR